MTRETAERIVKGITDKIEANTADMNDWAEFWGFTVDEYEEFLDKAIKSLEQQTTSFEWCTDCKEYDQEKHCCHRWSKVIRNTVEEMKQEPCEDAISRETLTHDLQKLIESWKKYPVMAEEIKGVEAALGYVKMIPPVQPKPKTGHWIPVSERLPKSAGVYIVTREFTDGFECADLTDACYFDGTSTWHDDNRINHGREYVDKKIKAWMPLPEPYKPQERSDKE